MNEKAEDLLEQMQHFAKIQVAANSLADNWLGVEAAAIYCGQVPVETFRKFPSTDKSFPKPAVVGRRLAWRKSDLDSWMRKRAA